MKSYLLLIVMLCPAAMLMAQDKITGTVLSKDDQMPVPGASVKIKNTRLGTSTDSAGKFIIYASIPSTFVVSSLGYKTREVVVEAATSKQLRIYLENDERVLQEVVVSTGYQEIATERLTGSYSHVGEPLLNRRVSTDIISRLESMVPGLVFNRTGTNVSNQTQISIRGQSTLFARPDPLIVIDNFPYEGDINSINPNDIESITVLKDAAAASIWGAKAANGVIVISTKRGQYNKGDRFSYNSNITFRPKPDIFYQPRMTTGEFIDHEKSLFAKGFYKSTENSATKAPLTPVVELLIAQREGVMSAGEVDAAIQELKQLDVRQDLDRYMFRSTQTQQHALNFSGGSSRQNYYASLGYDKSAGELVGNSSSRISATGRSRYLLLKQKMELTTGVSYSVNNNRQNNPGTHTFLFSSSNGAPMYPYARFADDAGRPLTVTRDYRANFIHAAENAGMQDWRYRPLEEVNEVDNLDKVTDYRFNVRANYKVIPGLNAEVLYQYGGIVTKGRTLQSGRSWFARDLINRLSVLNANGTIISPVPEGGILDSRNITVASHNLRGQLNFSRTFAEHNVSALAGYEVGQQNTNGNTFRTYGYDAEHAKGARVDYISTFPRYNFPASRQNIPFIDSETDLTDRNLSYYMNAGYSYGGRYIVSASARLDQSNLFGVAANQKGVPLWSAGFAWNLANESFYDFAAVPHLKLRASYGYNGNISKSVTAYTTARLAGTNSLTGLPYSTITNPPNPELRWERVKVVNLGIDLGLKNNRILGTVEYFHKKGVDLIGDSQLAPTTGLISFRGNVASTSGNGVDLSISSKNLDGPVKWYSDWLLSYYKDKVTSYNVTTDVVSFLQTGYYPLEGRPLYGIYSFKSAGLSPLTGDPRGVLDGQPSQDYASIFAASTPDNIIFNGSARPTVFGSLRNTLSWHGLSVSASITYRLGYYFRQESVNYGQLMSGMVSHGDYSRRWIKPGDENSTFVPSTPVSNNNNRNNFYRFSEVLVERGDHIRWQDLNISYDFYRSKMPQLPFEHAQLYLFAENLGIIWKAAKTDIDPDYPKALSRPVRTIALGLKVDF